MMKGLPGIRRAGREHRERKVYAGLLGLMVLLAACASKKQPQQTDTPSVVDSTAVADTLASQATQAEAGPDSVAPALPLTYAERRGRRLFLHYCAVCHGESGAGDGFNAWNLDRKPRDFTNSDFMKAVSDEQLIEVTIQGGRGMNKSPLMPAWEHTMTPGEVKDVVAFIRTLVPAAIHETAPRDSL